MVDFESLALMNDSKKEDDPRLLFKSLSKTNGINDLYEIQSNALSQWYSRRNEKDLVIKMPTGSGKTLVGLLLAKASANELSSGALYLVENKQLVDQVITQAKKVGIKAVPYRRKESLNADFNNGETIVVGSYQALFNGKSLFGIDGNSLSNHINLGTIVIDDAHASLSAIRDACAIKLDLEEPLYKEITQLFSHSFDSIGLDSTFNDMINGGAGVTDSTVLEVPVFEWYKKIKDVKKLLEKNIQEKNISEELSSLYFCWPLLKDRLSYCRCVVSRTSITIFPYLPLTGAFPAFREAKRKVYMSATFADDSAMLKTFNINKTVVENPICPDSYSGIGKRMILNTPDGMAEEELAELIQQISKCEVKPNTLIESPSKQDAKKWERWFSIASGETIEEHIDMLIKNKASAKTVVIINRYNGIDLPDDACRLVVLHGIPYGRSDIDLLDEKQLKDSKIYIRLVAEKIEQGIGRGTRGASDYCVVLLHGYDLQQWIKTQRNAQYLTAATRAQIDMGSTIAKKSGGSKEEFREVILQGVKGEESFLDYCARQTELIAKNYSDPGSSESTLLIAEVMRAAWEEWIDLRPSMAIQKINKIDCTVAKDDPSFYGLLMQMASAIAFSNQNKEESKRYQNKAHEFNRNLYSIGDGDNFDENIDFVNNIATNNVPVVYLEGETDEKYFKRAVEVYGINIPFEFLQTGTKDNQGQSKNGGCGQLKKLVAAIRNNPTVTGKKIAVIYDCDVTGIETNNACGVFELSLKQFDNEKGIKKGIENALYLDDYDLKDFYTKRDLPVDYGGTHVMYELNKMKLCDFICMKSDAELKEVFKNLRPVIDDLVRYFSQ
jgi:helicase superfamily